MIGTHIQLGTVVKITKDGARYKAVSTSGEDFTDVLESYQMSKAFDAGSALKYTEVTNGMQWRKVSMAEYDTLVKTVTESSLQNDESTHADILNLLKTSDSLRPPSYKMSDLKWKFSIRAVLRGKNLMVTGPQGCGKTVLAFTLAEVLNRPLFNIPLGSTQDPRSVIIGNTHFKHGDGTFVAPSYFSRAIQQPNAIILLDELTRAHPDAWNLLMPVLDYKQRFLRVDEDPNTPTINVAPGVTFIATANIGNIFTSTRTLDAALVDRFTVIEVDPLDKDSEYDLLTLRYPSVDTKFIESVVGIAHDVRQQAGSDDAKVSNIISTRMTIEMTELIHDGFSLIDAAEVAIYPSFSSAGGLSSERHFVKQIVQKYLPTKHDNKTSPFTINDNKLPWAT